MLETSWIFKLNQVWFWTPHSCSQRKSLCMLLKRSPEMGFSNAFFLLENAINYNCLPLRISLSNCLFSGVTDELTGKMKHFGLITSCNYSSCKGTSSYIFYNCLFLYNMQLYLPPFKTLTMPLHFQEKVNMRWL